MARVHLKVIENRSSLRSDGSHAVVFPADVHGRFQTARKIFFGFLIAVYVLLPWIQIGGHPALFLDIEHRQFDIFGMTFNAQDAWLLFFLLTGIAFAILSLTAIAGRVWCGWGCPQTVFLEAVFRRIERFVEGSRIDRMRRAEGPWNFDRIWRTSVVHVLFAAVSIALAHVFISYFVSIPRLYQMMQSGPSQHIEAFIWTSAISSGLYFNFAHFREQLCLGICPYGRLQGALTDAHALTVGYDINRGEPRGKASDPNAGACVDCNRCVAVCPTGIDIRNGTQLDCIGCTACIDACDEVMDKLNRPRGLVRYDSVAGLEGRPRKFIRPRVIAYAIFGLAGIIASTTAFASRKPFEANLLRLRGAPYTMDGDTVRNAFELHVVNKRDVQMQITITPTAAKDVTVVVAMPTLHLAPRDQASVPVFVTVPKGKFSPDFALPVEIRAEGIEPPINVIAPILGPGSAASP